MPRKLSSIAPDWWDYTTLEDDLISDAAALTPSDIQQLSRPGFRVVMYDTLEDFYLAEALEYIHAWREATADNPVGICGPIGPTEQLPLVAPLGNELGLSLQHSHFWGMDEWVGDDGREVPTDHPFRSSGRIVNCVSTELRPARQCRRKISLFPRSTNGLSRELGKVFAAR
ncbi:MAG: hypothetical protein Ct9H300mP7_3470 [Verrucomicrobiota bacterium]|nr:MAG: hypothetical protein Ct9H300mP7_3470 [Verrucomicrobiota bacterium]